MPRPLAYKCALIELFLGDAKMNNNATTNLVAGLALGLAAGVALGILLAPREGQETREAVREAIASGMERLRRRSEEGS